MREYWKSMDRRMFDFTAFYDRMAAELPANPVIAEVGVADGASVVYLAEQMLNRNKHPLIHAVDDLSYGGADQLLTLQRHLAEADLGQRIEVLAVSSLLASCRFPDGHFDFVFLDTSHKFEETKAEIRLWWRKVKEDGVLAGHDYNEQEGVNVKAAVDWVIPRWFLRQDIPDRHFEPEPALCVEKTEQNLGVWWVRKRWYVRLN